MLKILHVIFVILFYVALFNPYKCYYLGKYIVN
jgi:uncharacterized membrane protein YtjA (UPF0391 family)